jgi:hypothetical protein
MSGVFLSYSRGDRALAEQIIQGFRVLGIDVWWDEDMPGVDWQEELERQIGELAGVVVLWTTNSSASKNVKDEARLGLRSEKLVNILAGTSEPPFPFDRVNGLPLDGWTGREQHRGWMRVVQTVEALMVKAGGAKPGQIMSALAQRDHALRQAQDSIGEAEQAFQDAQTREAQAVEAAGAAAAALAHAEEQFQRVVEMRASPAVVRAVQLELDEAQAARAAASQVQRAAKGELSEASRAMARAKVALDRLVSDIIPMSPASLGRQSPHVIDPGPPVEQMQAVPTTPPTAAQIVTARSAQAAAPSPKNVGARGAFAAAGVTVIALIGAAMVFHRTGPRPGVSSAPAASDATPVSTPTPVSADPTGQAVRAAAALDGNWALNGLTCANPVALAVKDGLLLMTVSGATSSTTIDPSGDPDAIAAHSEDGGKYSYRLGQRGKLTVTGPKGPLMEMTKCGS